MNDSFHRHDCSMCRLEAKWLAEGFVPAVDDGAGNTTWDLTPEQVLEVFGDDAPEDRMDISLIRIVLPEPLHRLGRNDPCWCGSGAKYKRCHLGAIAN